MLKKNGWYIILCLGIVLLAAILFFTYRYAKGVQQVNKEVQDTTQRALENSKEAVKMAMTIKPKEEEKKPTSVEGVIPIFMYHFVGEDPGQNPYPENVVKTSMLDQQLKYLKENNYDTIFVTDLKELHRYEKPVALTFDDGFLDVYVNAFPLLKQYQLKASMYVVNEFIGTPGYCGVEQLKEMQDSGLVSIEAHTVSHNRLATLSASRIETELADSKAYIKQHFDKDSTVLCYPYGSYNNTVIDIAKKYYDYALAMDGGVYDTKKHKNLYEIPRIYANRSMSLNAFINYCKTANVKVEWEN